MNAPIAKPKTGTSEFWILGIALVFPSVLTWIYFVALKSYEPWLQQTAYSIGKAIQFTAPIVFVWLWKRDFLKTSPLLPKPWNWNRWDVIGLAFGAIVVAAMIGLYYGFFAGTQIAEVLIEKANQKTVGIGIDTSLKFLGLGVFYALCHSFMEEYYWRWFVYGRLKNYIAPLGANVISSLGFMAHHVILLAVFFEGNFGLALLLASGVGIGGAFWAWLYDRSGDLRSPWLSHLIVDAGIFSLGFLLIREFLVG